MKINGIKYKKRATVITSGGRSIGKMFYLLQNFGAIKKQKELCVNLISEFTLIQQRKSKLSKSDRDIVVRMFNCNYEIIPESK